MRSPEPRFWTDRDPAAKSEGAEIAVLSKHLGRPLMPWQRRVVDVATEKTAHGMYRYPTVLITVPRQSGKTTLVAPVQLHRIMTRPGINAYFTAQTGKDAGERMDDIIKLVAESPLASLFKVHLPAGSKGLSVAHKMPNGMPARSRVRTFAPGPSALHGTTPHLVTLDEIWKFDTLQGQALMGAIGPAQSTLEGHSQVWMISTMGTTQSGFMNELVERGRAGHPSMCYFEWSMPDGLDPYDPQTWFVFHPALGNTISVSYLEKEAADQPIGEWMRAYMNRITMTSEPVIAPEDWDALEQDPAGGPPARSEIAITYAAAPDNAAGAFMATWRDDDGAPCIRVLHAAPGTQWMVDVGVELHAWNPVAFGADDGGSTRRITDELCRRLGEDAVTTTTGKDFATACEVLLTAASAEKTLKHDGSRTLAANVANLALKRHSDAPVKFSRSDSAGPIVGIEAAAVGLWLYDHKPAPGWAPVTRY